MAVKLTLIISAFILIFDLTVGQFQPQNNPNNNLLTNGQQFVGNNGRQFNQPTGGEPTFPVNNNFNNGQGNPTNGRFPGNNIPGQPVNPGINPNTLGINTPINNNQIPGQGGFPNNNNPGAFPGNNPTGIASFQPGFQTVNNQFQNPFIAGNNFGPGFGGPGGFGPGGPGGPGAPGGPGTPGGQLLMSLSQNFNNYRYGTCYFNVTSGSSIMGRADFRQFIFGEWPVEIRIQVVGLPTSPVDTQRGIHIHEYGDTGGNCARVGPHFNPTLTRHGGRNNYPFLRHVGDLGNMLQSPRGVASTQFRDNIISLQGQNSIIGRSLVIKYERDDEGTGTSSRSQVDGNARTPVACCTIGRAGPGNWQDPYTEEELMTMSGGVWSTGGGGSTFGGLNTNTGFNTPNNNNNNNNNAFSFGTSGNTNTNFNTPNNNNNPPQNPAFTFGDQSGNQAGSSNTNSFGFLGNNGKKRRKRSTE